MPATNTDTLTMQLARRFNMHLVDIELMFAKFWSTADFLSDNHHLNQEAQPASAEHISQPGAQQKRLQAEAGWAQTLSSSWKIAQGSHARSEGPGLQRKGQG